MKLLNFALIKITVCLILGISFAHFFNIPLQYSLLSVLTLIIGLSVCLWMERDRLVKSSIFGMLTMLTFIGIGIITYQLHDQTQFKKHYTQHVDPISDTSNTIKFRIREVLKSGSFHNKYVVDVLNIDEQSLLGKVLLNVTKDGLQPLFKVDDIVITTSPFTHLNPPLNPNQFDYKAYLEKQHIHNQIYTDHAHLMQLPVEANSVFGYAAKLRHNINQKLKFYDFKPSELSIINALLLGQRQDISSDIYDSYAKAGAVHILAISGLHVGIILLLLNWLFKPLEFLKKGKIIKVILIVLLLWGFAIVAGLSASVTRAVTMFSIVAVGMNLKRPSNIYNTLAASMLLLLLFKPLFLFDVGFQMSYLAVIAIVSFQPFMVRLWSPKFWPIKKLWQIFTVTLAAQLGVVPISLFYFHQFPGLFFLSNLVIIPFLGLILGLGILIILLALLHILPFWLAGIYGAIIDLMNSFVKWIALQERFLMSDIAFGMAQVITAYILVISLFVLMRKQNFRRMALLMLAILTFQITLIYEKEGNNSSEFIVFHKNRTSLIGFKTKKSLNVAHSRDSISTVNESVIRNYNLGHRVKETTWEPIQNLYGVAHKKLLIIDSLGVHQVPDLNPELILLRDSPKINLTRVLDSLKPELVIVDGSNFKTYIMRWEQSCREQHIPIHITGRDGAFILPINPPHITP